MTHDDLAAHARALLDTNRYLTLGTIDPDGRPWTSPVYFSSMGLRAFYWTSATDAQHSRNLAERPQVSIVVSTPPSRRTTAAPCMRSERPASCPVTTSTADWRSTPGPAIGAADR